MLRCVLALALASGALAAQLRWDTACSTYRLLSSSSGRTVANGTCTPVPRAHHTVSVRYNGDVVVFGGNPVRLPRRQRSDLWLYRPADGAWLQLAPDWRERTSDWNVTAWCEGPESAGPPPRQGHVAVIDDSSDSLYISGGTCGTTPLTDLWSYRFATGLWRRLSTSAPLLTNHSAVMHQGSLYIFGGRNYTTGARTRALWRWDGARWSLLLDTPYGPAARQSHAAVLVANDMYVYGGVAADDTLLGDLWSLNLDTLVWSQHLPDQMPPARRGHAAAACGDRYIIVHGGAYGPTAPPMSDTWRYDVSATKWTIISEDSAMRRTLSSMACRANRLWMFGGITTSSYGETGGLSDLVLMALH
eukprot:m51a1_g5268 hypothetical protein (360) ;mRNA; r:132742-134840